MLLLTFEPPSVTMRSGVWATSASHVPPGWDGLTAANSPWILYYLSSFVPTTLTAPKNGGILLECTMQEDIGYLIERPAD